MTPAQFRKKGHGKTGPWLDLVNSEEWDTFGRRTEHLGDPSWLHFFLAHWKFAAPRNVPFPLAKFLNLRGALRRSCGNLAAGRRIPAAESRALNAALKVVGRHQLIQRQNGLQVEFLPMSEGWEWILAQTTLSFALLLTHGQETRVKICRNPDCRWVFYDTTKAKSRRWCSDKVCGNRDRVRRARARTSHAR